MLPSHGSMTMDEAINPILLENWEAEHGYTPDYMES